MGTPSTSLASLRPDLAAGFEEFDIEMDRAGFIGLQVAPVINVGLASGTFAKIPVEQMLRNEITERAPGSGYHRGSWTFDKDTYTTVENGWEEPVDDNEAAMYGQWVDAYAMASRRAYDAVLRNLERRIAAMMFNTTTWTGAELTTAVSIPWTTAASAVPITNINAAVDKVRASSGMWANTLILSREAFRALRIDAQIIDQVKYSGFYDPTQKGITTRVLAQVFDLERVVVAGGTQNASDSGQAAAFTPIWDKTMAMVCYVNYAGDTKVPSVAKTFHWAGDGSQINGTFDSYREEQTRSEVVRVRNQTGEKVLYPELAHLLTAVT